MKRFIFALTVLLTARPGRADEGMWLVNQFPRQQVAKQHGFEMPDALLERIQLGSARFNNGGSGSFVSPDGMLFTNHHVGSECIFQLSGKENDYLANGFYAKNLADEKACPDLEINVLLKAEEITGKVNAGIASSTPAAQAAQARKANQARIEKECAAATGNRCDVVTLFGGGRFDLYQYKKYTDVRLVFAPESAIAAFGGDPDNFTYPRYCLDFALFRAYENGKPAQVKHYFPFSKTGAREGELTFVSGNPGTTGRLATVAQLEYYRDHSYPFVLARLKAQIDALRAYGATDPERRRQAEDLLNSNLNSVKAYTGFLRGLRDPKLIEHRRREEGEIRRAAGDEAPWKAIAAAVAAQREFYKRYLLLDYYVTRGSELLDVARGVVRLAAEKGRPDGERLKEYRDAALPSLTAKLYAATPVYEGLETAVLTEMLTFVQRELGANDPAVKQLLGGKTPAQAAEAAVAGTRMKDPAARKALDTPEKVAASNDSMIALARIVDKLGRPLRKRYEDEVEAVLQANESRLAQARLKAAAGRPVYPDATFTFRISYGPVKGYTVNGTERIPWTTTYEGLYKRATGEEPFKLPPSWIAAKPRLDLSVPFNFVSTNDTHGGNSGSPTLNTKGEIVGILFDGNLEGLPNKFVYRDETERSVHVASQGIVEALRKVYRAERVLKELGF